MIERVLKMTKDHIETFRPIKRPSKTRIAMGSQGGIKPYQKVMAGIDMNIHDAINTNENIKEGIDYAHNNVDAEILIEKEQTIQELRETIGILEIKLKKFEQLVKLKDQKIQTLSNKLQKYQGHTGE